MLTDIVNTYLSVRRAVGFKLQSVEKCLLSYANFATARGDIRCSARPLLSGLRWHPRKTNARTGLRF